MNLVTLNHDYSQLISFDIEVGYWKLSFQETQVNLIGLLEKPDIMFPSRIFKNGILWTNLRNYSEDLRLC